MMGIFVWDITPLMDKAVCTPGFSDSVFFIPGWASVSALALFASILFIAMYYMIASFFQNQQAIATAKMELYEVFVSLAIFVALFMLLSGMCSVKTGDMFPQVDADLQDHTVYYSAINSLTGFADTTLQLMNYQYLIYMVIDWVTTMEISSTPMGIGATLKPTLGLGSAVKPVLNNAFTAETIGVITTEAQAFVMDYGTYGLLKYFLPIALVLRSFTPTRRIGGTIIALTAVFLFIYPLITIPTYMVANASLKSSVEYFKSAWGADVINGWTSLKLLFEFMFKYIWGPDFLMAYSLAVMPFIAKVFIGAVFMPLFNTLILVTTARFLSKSLGEEIDITNLTRMI